MWVWGGLTLSYPQTVAERKFLSLLIIPHSPEAGGREVPTLIFLLTGARHAPCGDCSCPLDLNSLC